MAFGNTSSQCSKIGRTIEQLQDICSDDSIQILMLAAGQHCLNVKFYDLLQEPSIHTYMCSVEVGSLLQGQGCIGYGPTKQDAKMNAAEEAIFELTQTLKDLSPSSTLSSEQSAVSDISFNSKETNPFLLSKSTPERKPSATPHQFFSGWNGAAQCPLASASNGNPIGKLKELTDSNGWTAPVYEMVDEYGEDHKKTFVYQCKFRTKISEGIANNKKTAKRQAAEEMLSLIEPRHGSTAKAIHSSSGSVQEPYFRSSVKSAKPSLPSTRTLKADYHCDKLEKLALEKKWTVTWHDIGESGYSGNALCFVRIKTNPVTVCSGSGPTKLCARDSAAMNALKILTK